MYSKQNIPYIEPPMLTRSQKQRKTHQHLVQAVYANLLQPMTADPEECPLPHQPNLECDDAYFEARLQTIIQDKNLLQSEIANHLHRPWEQLPPIEHAILLLSCAELKAYPKQAGLVISEMLMLTKHFIESQHCTHINGILHALSQKLQATNPE